MESPSAGDPRIKCEDDGLKVAEQQALGTFERGDYARPSSPRSLSMRHAPRKDSWPLAAVFGNPSRPAEFGNYYPVTLGLDPRLSLPWSLRRQEILASSARMTG